MIIFVNGVFDIIQTGHFNLLMFCRELAGEDGKLIVAIDEDEKVWADKGLKRPIFNVHERAKAILDLRMTNKPVVDRIEFFHTDHELEMLVRRLNPDYMVKGGDYRNKRVVGAEYTKVLFFDTVEGYSTTNIVERILEKYKS